jgi:peroxiredoxin
LQAGPLDSLQKAGMALNIGDEAPDFELADHTGRTIRLSDFRGKHSVVLAFYVYANTPG